MSYQLVRLLLYRLTKRKFTCTHVNLGTQSMHVVCLVSLKGGAGKSTVVQSLAVCASQHDQKTLIVELDSQGSLKNWAKRREAAEPEVLQTLPQSLDDVLSDARCRGVGWVFIDTPGHESSSARVAMGVADLILIPCKIQSMKDFDAVVLTVEDARRADKPAYVVMSQVPPNAKKLVRRRQVEIQEKYGIAVLSRYVTRRADFEYCDERGLSAAELNPTGSAAEEISRLYQLLLSIFVTERSKRTAAEGASLSPIEERYISESQITVDPIDLTPAAIDPDAQPKTEEQLEAERGSETIRRKVN